MPRSDSSSSGCELNHWLIPVNSGATPKSSSSSVSRASVVSALHEIVDPARGGGALLEALQGLRVAGDLRLQPRVEPERHEHGDRDDRPAEGFPDERSPASQGRQVQPPPRSDCDSEQHHARAEGVRERHEHSRDTEALGGRDRRDGGDDRPCARREQQPEADAEEEAAADVARPAAAERQEGPLDETTERGDEQRQSEERDDADRDVSEEVRGQVERGQERGRGERERREAENEAGNDGIRTPRATRRAAGEEDRQDWKDARTDRRDHAGHEGDADEQCHLGRW